MDIKALGVPQMGRYEVPTFKAPAVEAESASPSAPQDSCTLGGSRSFTVSGLDRQAMQDFKAQVLANNERNQVDELPIIKGCALTLDASDEVTLSQLEDAQRQGLLSFTPDDPQSMSICEGQEFQPKFGNPQTQIFKPQNQLLGAEELHAQGYTGQGSCICILDTGIAPHPDIKDRIVAFKDFVNDRPEPYDDHGHGTHCAGIAAGDGTSSEGRYVGVAPEANLVGVKVLE